MSEAEFRSYRCGTAARWLPRAVAGSVLVLAMTTAGGIAPDNPLGLSQPLRIFVVMAGAVVALWLMRKGAELGLVVRVDPIGVGLARGKWSRRIEFDELERFEYEIPLANSKSWIPALVLRDRRGAAWRLPSMLTLGDRLVAELIERSGREDLATWADVLHLRRRMGRPGALTLIGYGVVLLLLGASWTAYGG